MAWLTGWQYRKKLTINGSSVGEQTNYQKYIHLFWGNGASSPPNLYFNGKARKDFNDIRFTQTDGETIINHFIWRNYIWNLSKVGSFLAKGTTGWDSGQLRQLGGIIDDSGRFHFWYGGYLTNWQVGYGYSDDMSSSAKGNYNPIIPYNAYDAGDSEVRDPSVIKIGSTYFIYSQAYRPGDSKLRIGLSKTTNPGGSSITHVGYVLVPGASGSFDDLWVASPAVLQDSSGTQYLFYEARKASPTEYRIGYATSNDGESFTKQGAIKNIDGSDFVNPHGIGQAIVPITVVSVNGIYYMFVHYYTGTEWRSGILKSTNLINWEWSQDHVTEVNGTSPFAIKKNGVWHIYTEEGGNANLNRWSNSPQSKGDALIWMEIPSIPADPGAVDIYVYYGKEDASDSSNILGTFIKGEDGVSGNFTTAVAGTGTITRVNGKYRFTEDSTDDCVVSGTIPADWKFLSQICEWQKVLNFSGQVFFGLFDSDTVANLIGTSAVAAPKRRFLCQRVPGAFGSADTLYVVYQNPGGTFYFWNGTGWQTTSIGFSISSRQNVEIRVWSDNTNFYMDIFRGGVSVMANPASIAISSVKAFSSGKCLIFGDIYTDGTWFNGWIDDYFVRKYVSPEPAWGVWGSEETESVNVTVDVGLQSGSKSLFSVSENTDQILSQNLVSGNKTLFSPSFILDQILAQNLQAGSNTIFQASHVTDQILSQNLLESITSLLSVLVSIDQDVSVNVIPVIGSPYDVTVVIPGIAVTVDLGLLLAIGSALETFLQTDQVLSQGIIEKLGSVFATSQNTDQILNQNILSALGAVLASSQFFDMTINLNTLSALASIYQILVQILAAPEKFGYLKLKMELPPALPEGDFAYEHPSLKVPD